jgi:acyl-CoA thioester hydrolase
MEDLLTRCTVIVTIPVAWGGMDANGHVNNIIYFRYFESVRIAYFEKLDFRNLQRETGIGLILASTECRYKIPLHYPETISVGTKILSMDEDRFVMGYEVYSHTNKKVAADGEGIIVTYDYNAGKKVVIPEDWRKQILELEKVKLDWE